MKEEQDITEKYGHYPVVLFEADQREVRRLHGGVARFRRRFFEPLVQDVLLNGGYEIDEHLRPESWMDILGSCWNRKKLLPHLMYLEHAIDIATKPQVIGLIRERIIRGSQETDPISLVTAAGHDAGRVESLQREWFENPEITGEIQELRKVLRRGLGEYNMQLVLGAMHNSTNGIVHYGWSDVAPIQEEVRRLIKHPAFNVLDSAYYNAGNRSFGSAAGPWRKLKEDSFGSFFTLDDKNVQTFLESARRRLWNED